ncbi:MAG: GAF domain-containing protein [Nitrospirota bacterium]|nr:GAF domain-containing protein [Nitrospirota bacterium]
MKNIDQLNKELASLCPGGAIDGGKADKALEIMGSYLQERFQVAYDEVALFRLVNNDYLCFVIPRELATKGTIPVNASQSIAAKTVTSMKATCFNDFQAQRHITFFEGIKFKEDIKGLIQRMLCAPLIAGENTIGVVQISRKGPDLSQCGPPFGQADLEALAQFCQTASKYLETIFKSMNEENS